ncbi:QacE family quaternary ammonium compound efflux SMR transporter [Virgibacillus necropolis]|uniref:QacE family quaternary ammonium compound efflux SMR transporter n=2 Tax=Virgibacillus necropolis TaxID=163877 RepID=A0A221MIP8_9BACI|nr:QacE family quaternary ammonium compound efflux SMR transporter [Virgibacillus necropolis]
MTFQENKKYGAEHARLERKYFYIHLIIFILVHGIFTLIFGLVSASDLPSGSYVTHIKDWIIHKDIGFYKNDSANSISSLWITVLFVHAIWGFSYTIFPKKKKESKNKDSKVTSQERGSSSKSLPIVKKNERKEITEGVAWLFLVLSGLVEIYWAAGLKSDSMGLLTLIAMLLSFELLIRATKKIPIGTAYAVFTGIGTIGTILVDILYFHEPFKMVKILLILLLALFIIGLKFSDDSDKKGEA